MCWTASALSGNAGGAINKLFVMPQPLKTCINFDKACRGDDPATFRVTLPLRSLSGVDLEPSVFITVAADPSSRRVTFRGERACLGDAALDARFRLSLSATLDARARRRRPSWRFGLQGRGGDAGGAGSVAQETGAAAPGAVQAGDGSAGSKDRRAGAAKVLGAQAGAPGADASLPGGSLVRLTQLWQCAGLDGQLSCVYI